MENLSWLRPSSTSSHSQSLKNDITSDTNRFPSKKDQMKGTQMQLETKRPALGDIPFNQRASASGRFQGAPVSAKATLTKATSLQPPQLLDVPSAIGSKGKGGNRDWIDFDKLNEDDPQSCSAYASSIFQYLREAESSKRANPKFLDEVQHDVNAKMRAILVDWLVEVSEEYKLCADTLYQAVNYIDRFLSIQVVQRNQLQLVGVTCMWVAAKYEEIYPPNVTDFCYITDNTYSKSQLVHFEEIILKKLSYELTVPTAKTFLRRLLQVCNPDELLHFLSNYLTELSLLDYNMLNFQPSIIAAAGMYLANLMLKRRPWDANLRHYSTYAPSDICQCVIALAAVHEAVSNSPNLAAIRDKYGHPRFQEVSRIAPVSVSTYMFG